MKSESSCAARSLRVWVSVCLVVVALAGCGGGGGGSALVATAPIAPANSVPTGPLALTAAGAAVGETGLAITSITRLTETLVSGTTYDYTFTLNIKNGPTALMGSRVELVSAGPGTTVVDGQVVVGTIAAGEAVAPVDTIALRHDRALPFDPTVLHWQVTPTPSRYTTQVTLAELGVTALGYTGTDAAVYVLPGSTAQRRLSLSLAVGVRAEEVSVAVEGVAAPEFAVVSSPSGVDMTFSATNRVAGDKLTGALRVTRASTRQHAIVPVEALVLAVVETRSGTVDATGGGVVTELGILSVLPNGLRQSVGMTVRIAPEPSGARRIEITFDRDLGAEKLQIQLPELPSSDSLPVGEPVAGGAVSSTGGRKTVLARTLADAVPADPRACTQLRDGSYQASSRADLSSSTSLGTVVLERQAFFDDNRADVDFRLGPLFRVDRADNRIIRLVQKPASILEAAVAHDAACSATNSITMLERVDWSQYEPVLFVHGFIFSQMGGGEGTWQRFPRLVLAPV